MSEFNKMILLITAAFLFNNVKGQTQCDTIYDFVEIWPKFKNGEHDVFNYITTELTPILSNCKKRNGSRISNTHIKLTITKTGSVVDACFPGLDASTNCTDELRKKLLKMNTWTPGQLKGKPVCCQYTIPISCLYWK